MKYLAEFAGSLVFLFGGYAYMSNITLKKTLVSTLNYIELVVAWSLAVGFGLTVAVAMGGDGFLNPGVVLGKMILGDITIQYGLLCLLMEFLAAGAAIILNVIFFWDSLKASKGVAKRGIYSAYPVERNLALNFIQEIFATFIFLFLVFICITHSGGNAILIGVVGFGAVALLSLSFNSTGFSMNAMRSVFSSIWFAILPIPNKDGESVDWTYQLVVNLVGSSIGGILAVIATTAITKAL